MAEDKFRKSLSPTDNVTANAVVGYTEELGLELAGIFATDTRSIPNLLKYHPKFPRSTQTLYKWLLTYPEFQEAWDAAKEIRSKVLMEECQYLADDLDVDNDWGSQRVGKAKLQIQVRMRMSKFYDPDAHSERKKVDHSGSVDVNHTFRDLAMLAAGKDPLDDAKTVESVEEAPDPKQIAADKRKAMFNQISDQTELKEVDVL